MLQHDPKERLAWKEVFEHELFVEKKKANGIVYEEWLGRGPLRYELMYELKFISNFREYTNHFETQIREYFCNKRNIIICNNERFSIGPADQDTLAELEIVDRDDVQEGTLYVLTFSLKLECFTRDMENIQKRERHNKYTLDITVQESPSQFVKDSTLEILADRIEIDMNPYPYSHPDISDASTTPNPENL